MYDLKKKVFLSFSVVIRSQNRWSSTEIVMQETNYIYTYLQIIYLWIIFLLYNKNIINLYNLFVS